MLGMIRYEWKKIWKNRLTQLSTIGCCLFLVFCVYMSIIQITATSRDGETFYGMKAVQVMKTNQQEVALTQETVDGLAGQYLAYTQNPKTSSENEAQQFLSEDIYKTFYLPNRDLLGFITNVYGKFGSGSNMRDILKENIGKNFEQARLERDQAYIETRKEKNQLNAREAAYWEKKSQKLSVERAGYQKGWSLILDAMTWPVLIMMIICIAIAPIFAGEYQSKCDSLVLCMRYGKSRLVLAKVVAVWLYTTCVYWGISLVYTGVYLGLLGTDGRQLPIQLKYPGMPVGYDLTMQQAVVTALFLAYVLTLGIMGITVVLSAVLKNTYAVIIFVFLLIIIPTFLAPDAGGYVWSHVLCLLPSKIADFSFQSYTAYTVGTVVLPWPTMAILENSVLAVVCSAIGFGVFRKHQVNK